MSDNDRNEAREAAARAFTGLCCVTVADEVCEDCVGALLYLASMHEAIEYLHLRDFAQQNAIRNLRRRLSRHEAHEDVVERMRVTARDLLHDMETTDVTIAIQERKEARDQARASLAALEQAQAEAAHLRRALEWLGDQWGGERHSGQKSDGHGPNCPLQPTVDLRDRTSCPYAPEAWHQPCQVIEGNITWRGCCLRSALAATEKAGGEDE